MTAATTTVATDLLNDLNNLLQAEASGSCANCGANENYTIQ